MISLFLSFNELNPKKISLRTRACRQEVTGITVNERLNPRRSYIKQLRAILHHCRIYGVFNTAKQFVEKGYCKNDYIKRIINDPDKEDEIRAWFSQVLIGKINYLRMIKGNKDLTYLSYAKRYNEIFQTPYFDITNLERFDACIRNSVFILSTADATEQGSGFFCPGYGLLTSFHVTEKGEHFGVFSIESYGEEPLSFADRGITDKSSDYNIDYALYSITTKKINPELVFPLGDSRKLRIGDTVIMIGYPEYLKGNSVTIQTCNIIGTKYYMGSSFYAVSGRVLHGASGGVVLNLSHEIVGIIKGGAVSMEESEHAINQGFVPIHLVIEHIKNNS